MKCWKGVILLMIVLSGPRRRPVSLLIVSRPTSHHRRPGGRPTSPTCGRGKLLHLNCS